MLLDLIYIPLMGLAFCLSFCPGSVTDVVQQASHRSPDWVCCSWGAWDGHSVWSEGSRWEHSYGGLQQEIWYNNKIYYNQQIANTIIGIPRPPPPPLGPEIVPWVMGLVYTLSSNKYKPVHSFLSLLSNKISFNSWYHFRIYISNVSFKETCIRSKDMFLI